jgi:hypothetical protein
MHSREVIDLTRSEQREFQMVLYSLPPGQAPQRGLIPSERRSRAVDLDLIEALLLDARKPGLLLRDQKSGDVQFKSVALVHDVPPGGTRTEPF